jgi:hypothetical protein
MKIRSCLKGNSHSVELEKAFVCLSVMSLDSSNKLLNNLTYSFVFLLFSTNVQQKFCQWYLVQTLYEVLVFKNHALVNMWSVLCGASFRNGPEFTGGIWLWYVENHARDYHVITHVLSLIFITHRVPASRILPASQTCWYKEADVQPWNINPLITFSLKETIYCGCILLSTTLFIKDIMARKKKITGPWCPCHLKSELNWAQSSKTLHFHVSAVIRKRE